GEPVIRQAVTRVMKEMGRQFVLGETIEGALDRAKELEAKGYTYSYDMLGEAAMTDADARGYHMAYADAIAAIAKTVKGNDIRANPGISIKLSALFARYDQLHRDQVMAELVPRARSLAVLARSSGIGLNIDAEEAARLDLSLDVIEAILSDPGLAGWDGFGVVVQAYGKRAAPVIDWLYDLAERLDRRIMVRLVKGAYWDTEIKLAQVEGLPGFPVFQTKPHTDISYICCAAKLLDETDRIYPQFATHNAHTMAAILDMAAERGTDAFEFQRLHGMGEALHDQVLQSEGSRCRIYAPVGHHKDLLAYLVRRLLENGANSSFVNQIFDADVASSDVAADPFEKLGAPGPDIAAPRDLFPDRINSSGADLGDPDVVATLQAEMSGASAWSFGASRQVCNPATGALVGTVDFCSADEAETRIAQVAPWAATVTKRAETLRKAADLYETHRAELFQLLCQEAGKTMIDCIGEVREAVDFLRYYADQAEAADGIVLGVVTCISPWNFPLAIFTGQIAAAVAAGNGVLAKPAEATSLVAQFAVGLLHQAGVPEDALILVPGEGGEVGPVICSNPKISGVCFTGSTATAQRIHRNMAEGLSPTAPLIAETGGLNAMIVDSTALPEQAVRDVIASAFQSAGQRCSALRCLYVQEDIADGFKRMLYGAMDALEVGDPADPATDVGPVIDASAAEKIRAHIEARRVLHQTKAPDTGHFIPPTVLAVSGIDDLGEEIFGPVLHLATYRAEEFDAVVAAINATGYGLTFGFHSRIDERVQDVIRDVTVGNLYINRNQIGAIVGSQPFGGHGLSGTGPKAGGPLYLPQFLRGASVPASGKALPGPTGEENIYTFTPRHNVVCFGPDAENDMAWAKTLGIQAEKVESAAAILERTDLELVIGSGPDLAGLRRSLAQREGPIVQVRSRETAALLLFKEQSVCIDITAAGGNVDLLGA
ncbi:MAG: bifunctional proline dehydrogenase/L-glutamate gamma-semialdehyde dehydrogenase PutA, partial [Pseudomonadota bacterium]